MPMSSDTLNADLLARYIAGEVTERERLQVAEFLQAHPEHAALTAQLRTLSESGATSDNVLNVDKAVARFFERITNHRDFVAVTRENSARDGVRKQGGLRSQILHKRLGVWGNRTLRQWIGGVTLATTIGALLVLARPKLSDHHLRPQTYTTGAEQQAKLTLEDGTRVTLSPRSRLQFVQTTKGVRTASVDGEAYFEIAPSQRTPFLVQTGVVTTSVLGTAFLVRHEAGETRVRVSVAEGKVRVTSQSSSHAGITLTAGQMGDLTDSTIHVTSVSDITPRTEWLHGRLFFHETPVAVVLETLHQWYGYQFQCADTTLAQRPVDIIVSAQSSTDALASLQLVLNVNLAVRGDTVKLTPQSHARRKGMPPVRTYDVWAPTREVGR